MAEYDRNKDVVLFKEGYSANKTKGNRFLNVVSYSYNGGEKKVRIEVSNQNTNPNCDPKKKWIRVPGITSLTKDEVKGLIKLLEKSLTKI